MHELTCVVTVVLSVCRQLDDDAPTVCHNGVWNNVVEVKRPVFEYIPASFADSDDEEIDERRQRALYGQRAPAAADYVADPPRQPPHLTQVLLNQSSHQDPEMLPVPQHVVLNHLNVEQSTNTNVRVTGITQRFKPNSHTKITHKFVTTVYYCPASSVSSPPGSTHFTPFSSSPLPPSSVSSPSPPHHPSSPVSTPSLSSQFQQANLSSPTHASTSTSTSISSTMSNAMQMDQSGETIQIGQYQPH